MRHIALTPRQAEVAKLLSKGYSQAEVAAILEISPRTVEHHTRQIRIKAKTRTTRAAIRARSRTVRADQTGVPTR